MVSGDFAALQKLQDDLERLAEAAERSAAAAAPRITERHKAEVDLVKTGALRDSLQWTAEGTELHISAVDYAKYHAARLLPPPGWDAIVTEESEKAIVDIMRGK